MSSATGANDSVRSGAIKFAVQVGPFAVVTVTLFGASVAVTFPSV